MVSLFSVITSNTSENIGIIFKRHEPEFWPQTREKLVNESPAMISQQSADGNRWVSLVEPA